MSGESRQLRPTIHNIVRSLEDLRLASGMTAKELSYRADFSPNWWSITRNVGKGSLLFTLDRAAKVFGLRLALVPIEQNKEIN
jgi:hypothetical protein